MARYAFFTVFAEVPDGAETVPAEWHGNTPEGAMYTADILNDPTPDTIEAAGRLAGRAQRRAFDAMKGQDRDA